MAATDFESDDESGVTSIASKSSEASKTCCAAYCAPSDVAARGCKPMPTAMESLMRADYVVWRKNYNSPTSSNGSGYAAGSVDARTPMSTEGPNSSGQPKAHDEVFAQLYDIRQDRTDSRMGTPMLGPLSSSQLASNSVTNISRTNLPAYQTTAPFSVNFSRSLLSSLADDSHDHSQESLNAAFLREGLMESTLPGRRLTAALKRRRTVQSIHL